MKRGLILLSVALLAQATADAKPQKVLGPGMGGSNFRVAYVQPAGTTVQLSKDTIYVLTGWYFVDSLATLKIEPGTLILGDSASGGTLIVRRSAKIIAPGTVQQPIVFTSMKAAGLRRPGDWGGVIILGNAPTNKPTSQQIEGGFGSASNNAAMYGGSNADDSSGVLQYVRIEFAGIAFAQDNEINGLTFGGVGRKTVVDHVQVSFANDDDFEFFGGTVQAKYLVGWRSLDDNFDTDYGFSGRLQFLYTKRDPLVFDYSSSGSSNGEESDNEGSSPFSALPRTSARFSNWTLVGPLSDTSNLSTLNSHWGYVAMLRRATQLSIYNSIMMGWGKGINIRDSLTQVAALNNDLELRHISLQAPRDVVVSSSSPSAGLPTGFNASTWFNTATFGNIGGTGPRQTTDIGLPAAVWNLNNTNNPVPLPSSEAATATAAFDGRLTSDSWFTNVTYRGAFDPSKPMSQQWTAGWTNFDPQSTDYSNGVTEVNGLETIAPVEFSLGQNYPNPFNPTTTITYALANASTVRLEVFNIVGQKVAVLANGFQQAGSYQVNFDAKGLSSGVYFYTIRTDRFQLMRKMLLMK